MHEDTADNTPLPALALADTPFWAQRLARSLALCFVLLLIALALAPWMQTVTGLGRVVAYAPIERQQVLEAPVDGRVAQWWVREGSVVQKGDQIAAITDNDPRLIARIEAERSTLLSRIGTNEARIGTLQQRLVLAEQSRDMAINGARSRTGMAGDRRRAAEQALDAARAALRTAELNFERQQRLLAKGLTSRRNWELAQLERAQRATEVERGLAALNAARSEVAALSADQSKIAADADANIEKARGELNKAQEELAYAQAELLKVETRLARQETQIITAPRDGTVLRLAANPGAELLKAGDPLAVLIPSTESRAVELWVDGNDVPLITVGRKARLQFEGYPAVQFSGWPEVAVGTFGARVALIDATDNGEGKFRLVLLPDPETDPWPDERFLRQGVLVNGWILLNQVRLGYELWRNFNGFPPLMLPNYPPLEKVKPSQPPKGMEAGAISGKK